MINKVDKIADKTKLFPFISEITNGREFAAVHPVTALVLIAPFAYLGLVETLFGYPLDMYEELFEEKLIRGSELLEYLAIAELQTMGMPPELIVEGPASLSNQADQIRRPPPALQHAGWPAVTPSG